MKIFIIDDEINFVNKIKKCISINYPAYQLMTFTNSQVALEAAKIKKPDLVFTDIEMPKFNGLDLARAFKTINPKVSIIFCTAYSEYAIKAFQIHASGYLLKPYTDKDILRELENINSFNYLPKKKRLIYSNLW